MDFIKFIPVVSLILGLPILIISIRKWVDFESNRYFNQYSKQSSFAYYMYEKTHFGDFERLGKEFGIAAFTGGPMLSPLQRERLLSVTDPVRVIHSLRKYRQYITIEEGGITLFEWKNKRYRNSEYRKFVKCLCFLIFILFIVPLLVGPFYIFVIQPGISDSIRALPVLKQFLFYTVLGGEFLMCGFLALIKGVRVTEAEWLIKDNVKASDLLLKSNAFLQTNKAVKNS